MPSLKIVVREIGASSAAIMIPNLAKRYLDCYDSFNMPPEWIAIKNPFNEKVKGGNIQVYKTGEPAVTNHMKRTLKGYYIESVMIVPIKRNNATIAMLEIIHSEDKTFSDSDLQKATAFAKDIETRLP